jgi:branched-chain amino acid transport system ATP-binding protein
MSTARTREEPHEHPHETAMTTTSKSPLLAVAGVTKRYGGLAANADITFDVREGEIVGIIGPNGAGKSTLFDLITGVQSVDEGRVSFAGHDITGLRADRIASLGVARTFQKLKPFTDLTVTENVMVGALARTANMQAARDMALEALAFVDLLEKRNHFARELSTGQRKRLELARGLAMQPRLILMDEVTGGVDQRTIPGLVDLVLELKSRGVTIVTIEHNMEVMMRLADRILALYAGRRIAFGLPDAVRSDAKVVDAYLGGTVDAA